MMGKMQRNKYIQQIKFVFLLGLVFLCAQTNNASAQMMPPGGCTSQILDPAAGAATTMHPYGIDRGGGHTHQGVDIMLPLCFPVQNQPNCRMILNSANSPLWVFGRNPSTGLGYATRYKCGPRVEVRYGHLNGYNAASQTVSNGQSGSAQGTGHHIHYEVFVYNSSGGDGIQVDPECVWGAHRNQSDCCRGGAPGCTLGINPTDMCNDALLDQLRANARVRAMDIRPTSSSNTASFNNGNIIDPANVPLGQYPEFEPCDGSAPQPPPTPINTSPEGIEPPGPGTTVGTIMIPGTAGTTVFPPITPPVPPVPGTPGGAPNLAPPPTSGNATHTDGCATDTWTAMTNQAVMETRREDILNKRFIVKPDSVLDYSCFDIWADQTGTLAGPIFSETTRWDNLPVSLIPGTVRIQLGTLDQTTPPFAVETNYQINPTSNYANSTGAAGATYQLLGASSLDVAIDMLVRGVATVYLSQNFNHPFLSGSTPVGVTRASATSCNIMANVWRAAKCRNFDGTNVFYTFTDLATLGPGRDPRAWPSNMQCF